MPAVVLLAPVAGRKELKGSGVGPEEAASVGHAFQRALIKGTLESVPHIWRTDPALRGIFEAVANVERDMLDAVGGTHVPFDTTGQWVNGQMDQAR
jgi:hypothetical protein